MEAATARPAHRASKKRAAQITWTVIGVFLLAAVGVFGFLYAGVKPYATYERSGNIPPVSMFTTDPTASYAEAYDAPDIGVSLWHLSVRGHDVWTLLRVVDTTEPSAEPVELTLPIHAAIPSPDAMIQNLTDASLVRVAYAETPDVSAVGDYDVPILLEDASGNAAQVVSTLHVRAIADVVTVEAGDQAPTWEAFLYDGANGTPLDEITETMLHTPGDYALRFSFENQTYSAMLRVVDTVPPTGTGTFVHRKPSEPLTASDFVVGVRDETALTYDFLQAPDPFGRDVQDVTVRVTDAGGNTLDLASTLLISDADPILLEARKTALTAAECVADETRTVTVEPFVPDTVGTYRVKLTVDGEQELALVTVQDTIAPTVSLRGGTHYTHHPLPVEDLFAADDVAPVTLSYVQEPDWANADVQTVSVRAVDTAGNETVWETPLTLTKDTDAPALYGVIDRLTYVGEPIAYFAEVYAEDAVDGRVEPRVESNVRIDTEGVYEVVYYAADRSGNEVAKTCTFTVIQPTVTDEDIQKMVDSILSEILTPDMVTAEKLRAVFDYVQKRVTYGNGTNHNYTDWRKAAWDGYRNGKGDCYNIYSLTRALLDGIDVDYLSVERVKTYARRTRHYWVMVNIGTGWYCFDPTWTPRHKFNCFMWTVRECNSCRLYWNFDTTKYPAMATEKFDYDKVVQMERQGLLP